jgi:hypothetical protein
MRMSWLLVVLVACGSRDPVLRNVPQPNTKAVAGGAAAIAGAATLVDPNGQANRVQEAHKPDENIKPMKPGPAVPADVLDRLDQAPPVAEPPPPSERPVTTKTKKGPATAAPKSKSAPAPITPPKTNPLNPQ